MSTVATVYELKRQFSLLGAECEVCLACEYEEHLGQVMDRVAEELQRVERLLDASVPSSEIARINRCAAANDVPLDYEVLGILADCQRWQRETCGHFTVGRYEPLSSPLTSWNGPTAAGRNVSTALSATPSSTVTVSEPANGMHSTAGNIPRDPELPIRIDRRGRSVRFNNSALQLDLAAYGRAYALDSVAHILLNFAVFSGLLSVDGETFLAVGSQPDGNPWHVYPVVRRSGSRQEVTVTPNLSPTPLTECGLSVNEQVSVVAPSALQAFVLASALQTMPPAAARQLAAENELIYDGLTIEWRRS